ncbi:MAG: tRNA uridine-5-carboxymethylaminomethyl(34) synthesis GTPase MnmE [Erysipelotrichales bacterium]|nr:tRNA uridine-5-carboxymethylaminomethyl(34) synthesis GTPase MnmE [Erysipelotrichales bacterium]
MFMKTIAAIATPLSEGAIAIIRISGDEAISIANTLFSRDLTNIPSHQVVYGYIKDPKTQEYIDEVLVSVFRAPKTFTREDTVEINCHGGIYITKKILSLLLENGAELAERGEFTKRAFLNGRIDLTQAEAVQDLIEGKDSSTTRLAMNTLRGGIRTLIDPLKEDLIQMIAQIEVNIDYPEYYDVAQVETPQLLSKANQWLTKLEELIRKSHSGKIMREGIKTVILGKPNVGKSSLLNALLEEDKAIVSDVAGTTRDLVEGYVRLPSVTLHLIDTAGIHHTEDIVEKIGIERSHKAMEEADLVIVVLEAHEELSKEDEALLEASKDLNRIIVYNKVDLTQDIDSDKLYISAKDQHIEPLIDRIEEMYEEHTIALREPTFANERHIALLRQAHTHMETAVAALEAGMEIDLALIDIEQAYECIKDIIGEAKNMDLLDELFTRFCLGK